MYRHGVDVAASLHAREKKLWQETVAGFPAGDWRLTSPLCLDMQYGFQLWEQYLQQAEAMRKQIVPQNWLALSYEGMLERPHVAVAQVAEWLGREVTQEANHWVGHIHAERAFAFRRDAGLRTFSRRVMGSPWLERYGYGEKRS